MAGNDDLRGYEYDVYLNGKPYNDALCVKSDAFHTYAFEPGDLKAGVNEVTAFMKSPASHSGFDFIRLTPVKTKWFAQGMCIIVR